MDICILNFLKTGAFGDHIPTDVSELVPMHGKPETIYCLGDFFTDFSEIDEDDPGLLPLAAVYGDIQFFFHNDRPNAVVCNYSYENTTVPISKKFNLTNASLLKGNMRLAKFLEKMTKHNVEISDISLSLDKITNVRHISVRTIGGVEVNFHHESGARDFRLSQFIKSDE